MMLWKGTYAAACEPFQSVESILEFWQLSKRVVGTTMSLDDILALNFMDDFVETVASAATNNSFYNLFFSDSNNSFYNFI